QRAALSTALPPIPLGTQVALVRAMLLVDKGGGIVPSRVTESVQLRVFHEPSTRGFLADGRGSFGDQEFFEFRTARRQLFAGDSGGFHAVEPNEERFVTFGSAGDDPFEEHPTAPRGVRVLHTCVACHHALGIQSVRILPRLLKPNPRIDYGHPRWSVYARPAPLAKARRYDWGLLNGLWQSNP